jgi:protein SCO1/2
MRRSLATLVVLAGALASCSHSEEAAKEPPKQYKLHGEVTRLNEQGKTATINAEKIDGWMEAMSMEYPVKDQQDLSALHPNECVDATVFVQGNDFWVGNVKPSDATPGVCVAPKKPSDVK